MIFSVYVVITQNIANSLNELQSNIIHKEFWLFAIWRILSHYGDVFFVFLIRSLLFLRFEKITFFCYRVGEKTKVANYF